MPAVQAHGRQNRLVALDFDDFFPGVMPAGRTYTMGEMFLAAIRAGCQLARLERIMRPAAVTTTFGDFSFW